MSTPLRDKLHSHILGMVERKTKLTAGFTEFYKENGGKEKVLKQLQVSKSSSWKKKLAELFPGEFSVSKKGTISRVGQSGASQPKVLAKNDSKSTMKLVMKVDQVDESSLESHIQNWVKKVEGFSGKSKGRKGRKKISTDGVGKPCPTCNVQMVAGPKNGKPFMSTIEHIIPLSMGGDNTYTGEFPQLTAMCFACNQARNKVVQATKKSDRKGLVRFLITQVYGGVAYSQSAFMDLFNDHYQIQTGRKLEHKVGTNQEIHLIQAGFCGNNAVSTASLIFEMFGSHPVKNIILLEQREANLIDFDAWNPYAPEIILVPNGEDNLQLSALERVLSTTSKPICMICPTKSSQAFERILQSNDVILLNPIKEEKISAQSSIKSRLNGLMPWNWFTWAPKQIKSKPMVAEKPKIKPEMSHIELDENPTSLSNSEQVATKTTKEPDEMLIEITEKTATHSRKEKSTFHSPEWATEEQLEIISDIRTKLVSAIHHANQQGRNFRSGMTKIYDSYGGSAEVKQKLGLSKQMKMKDMFSKLFGNAFVFSGDTPPWVIDTLEPPSQDLRDEQKKKDQELLLQIGASDGLHAIEILRNTMIKAINGGTNKYTVDEIKSICFSIKTHLNLSWNGLFSEFNLTYPQGGNEVWIQNFSVMFEMSGLDYTKEVHENEPIFIFSTSIQSLPLLEKDEILAEKFEIKPVTRETWADEEQLRTISEMENKIKSKIHELAQKEEVYRTDIHLDKLYKPYGGSALLKKKMNLPRNTPLKEMFTKLFGDKFTLTGESPQWILTISNRDDVGSQEAE